MIKFLIGGSPCTHWSIAQSKARETEPEGIGWELFKNYLIAKEKFCPDFFLYENNKSAAQAIRTRISEELEVPLQYINSALVSAQNRWRFYAHNIPGVPQPEDRRIMLTDILESVAGEPPVPLNMTTGEKAQCLRETYYKDGIVMNGGLDRDVVEELWRKRKRKGQKKGDRIGFCNADRLQADENGICRRFKTLSASP